MTKDGGEITMNRFRKWLYKPKVSSHGSNAAVSRVLFTAFRWLTQYLTLISLIILYTVTHLLTPVYAALLPLLLLVLLIWDCYRLLNSLLSNFIFYLVWVLFG